MISYYYVSPRIKRGYFLASAYDLWILMFGLLTHERSFDGRKGEILFKWGYIKNGAYFFVCLLVCYGVLICLSIYCFFSSVLWVPFCLTLSLFILVSCFFVLKVLLFLFICLSVYLFCFLGVNCFPFSFSLICTMSHHYYSIGQYKTRHSTLYLGICKKWTKKDNLKS